MCLHENVYMEVHSSLLTRARRCKQPNVRGWMNGQIKGGLSVQWNMTHP